MLNWKNLKGGNQILQHKAMWIVTQSFVSLLLFCCFIFSSVFSPWIISAKVYLLFLLFGSFPIFNNCTFAGPITFNLAPWMNWPVAWNKQFLSTWTKKNTFPTGEKRYYSISQKSSHHLPTSPETCGCWSFFFCLVLLRLKKTFAYLVTTKSFHKMKTKETQGAFYSQHYFWLANLHSLA